MHDITIGEEHPQVQGRSTRSGRDQHGRIWRAIIDNKTGHPVSPPTPGFTAPVYPPEKYVRPDMRGRYTDLGDYFIDYDQWEADLVAARSEYDRRMQDIAHNQYQDNPEKALRERPRRLIAAVGREPVDPRIPRACRAGNKWILGLPNPATGLPYPKPEWAKEIFPDVVDDALTFPDVEEFPDVDDLPESGVSGAEGGVAADREFPRRLNNGRWKLSDGTTIRGSEEEAEAAQAALAQFADA